MNLPENPVGAGLDAETASDAGIRIFEDCVLVPQNFDFAYYILGAFADTFPARHTFMCVHHNMFS